MNLRFLVTVALIASIFIGTQAGTCYQCSDYQSEYHCTYYDQCEWKTSCVNTEQTNQQIAKDKLKTYPDCSTYSNMNCFNSRGKKPDTACYYDTTCKTQDTTVACASLTIEPRCRVVYGCIWDNTLCRTKTCGDLYYCYSVYIGNEQGLLCQYDSTTKTCKTLDHLTALDYQCRSSQFTWNGSACVDCAGVKEIEATVDDDDGTGDDSDGDDSGEEEVDDEENDNSDDVDDDDGDGSTGASTKPSDTIDDDDDSDSSKNSKVLVLLTTVVGLVLLQ